MKLLWVVAAAAALLPIWLVSGQDGGGLNVDPPPGAALRFTWGDADCDGMITPKDALAVLRFVEAGDDGHASCLLGDRWLVVPPYTYLHDHSANMPCPPCDSTR